MSRVVSTNRRNGFTLVELLVSLTVIAVIAGMVAIAVSGANRQARETRAQALTNALNLISLQIYEESTRRRVELPAGFSTKEARGLSALMWKRDWLRCSFPDRRSQSPGCM